MRVLGAMAGIILGWISALSLLGWIAGMIGIDLCKWRDSVGEEGKDV